MDAKAPNQVTIHATDKTNSTRRQTNMSNTILCVYNHFCLSQSESKHTQNDLWYLVACYLSLSLAHLFCFLDFIHLRSNLMITNNQSHSWFGCLWPEYYIKTIQLRNKHEQIRNTQFKYTDNPLLHQSFNKKEIKK